MPSPICRLLARTDRGAICGGVALHPAMQHRAEKLERPRPFVALPASAGWGVVRGGVRLHDAQCQPADEPQCLRPLASLRLPQHPPEGAQGLGRASPHSGRRAAVSIHLAARHRKPPSGRGREAQVRASGEKDQHECDRVGTAPPPPIRPPLSHALIAALRVMASLATLPCTIAPGSCSALAHWPPFSHALIVALRVMASPFYPALHSRMSHRGAAPASPTRRPPGIGHRPRPARKT